MAKLIEMDEQVTFSKQMEEDNGAPIILINKFNVNPEETDQFLRLGQTTLHTSRASQDLSQPSYIGVLLAAELSSTTQFGSLLQCTERQLTTSAFRLYYRSTHLALSHLLTCSRR